MKKKFVSASPTTSLPTLRLYTFLNCILGMQLSHFQLRKSVFNLGAKNTYCIKQYSTQILN